MSFITATFIIPKKIVEGLESGIYERVGGGIRESGTKRVVTWLREGGIHKFPPLPPPIGHLLNISASASVLNLGVSTMGFGLVLKRLQDLEKRLNETQELLNKLDRKADLTFYANFRAALDLALNAFTMSNCDNRRDMAIQAINRFLEAQHVYSGLLNSELDQGSQIADE